MDNGILAFFIFLDTISLFQTWYTSKHSSLLILKTLAYGNQNLAFGLVVAFGLQTLVVEGMKVDYPHCQLEYSRHGLCFPSFDR